MDINKLQKMINGAKKIVFFGGAGVSTESGLKDFRSKDGLYSSNISNLNPERILSKEYFDSNPLEFYDYYRKTFLNKIVKPNAAHYFLAKLEEKGKDITIITQNIDNLHQEAGSKKVIELHGSIKRNYAIKSKKMYYGTDIIGDIGIPYNEDNEIIKPDVVLYGENLKNDVINAAIEAISQADLMIIGGTSLTVYPAAGLINYFNGKNLVAVNRDPINIPNFIKGSIGEVFKKLTI